MAPERRDALSPWIEAGDDVDVIDVALEALVADVVRPPILTGPVDLDLLVEDVLEAADELTGPLADVFAAADDDDEAADLAGALVRHVWRDAHERSAAWVDDETDPDRLDRAFAALDAAGVATGWFTDRASVEPDDDAHGVALTTYHDIERLGLDVEVDLSVSFVPARPDADPDAIGREVIEALRAHGLAPVWDGRPGRAIVVPVRWRPHVPPVPEDDEDDELDDEDAERERVDAVFDEDTSEWLRCYLEHDGHFFEGFVRRRRETVVTGPIGSSPPPTVTRFPSLYEAIQSLRTRAGVLVDQGWAPTRHPGTPFDG